MVQESKVLRQALSRWRMARRRDEIAVDTPAAIKGRYLGATPTELDAWFPAWVRHELARGAQHG